MPMNTPNLIPNRSVGDINLGESITNYQLRNYTYYPRGDNYLEDLYTFENPPVDVFVDDQNRITTINCSSQCIWREKDLIRMPIMVFLKLVDTVPDSIENIYLMVNNQGQNQTVYHFDDLRLQIWVWRNRIRLVSCTSY